ncbi:histone acetyltransferase [Blastocladiella emersonii ATCC 22665]|nr:histone acetyltransferase [Blastocladiella emersonii ATCC 22665]
MNHNTPASAAPAPTNSLKRRASDDRGPSSSLAAATATAHPHPHSLSPQAKRQRSDSAPNAPSSANSPHARAGLPPLMTGASPSRSPRAWSPLASSPRSAPPPPPPKATSPTPARSAFAKPASPALPASPRSRPVGSPPPASPSKQQSLPPLPQSPSRPLPPLPRSPRVSQKSPRTAPLSPHVAQKSPRSAISPRPTGDAAAAAAARSPRARSPLSVPALHALPPPPPLFASPTSTAAAPAPATSTTGLNPAAPIMGLSTSLAPLTALSMSSPRFLGLDEPAEIPIAELIRPCAKALSPAMQEERDGIIDFRVVRNDGSRDSTILLTGLMNIFQRQLPKMPREYVGKLVYDKSHISMCLVKTDPLTVLGGICYKPFFERKFAEIVFCAITGTEQVKGYGSHLMNHLKDSVRATGDLRYFLTYADNYAIGYFRKQGFTTDITLDKAIWMGYIKDYEGGTIMQCTMVPRVKYLDVYQTLALQKEALYRKIFAVSKANIVYPGVTAFKRNGGMPIDPMTIPGIAEAGWTPELSQERSKQAKSPLYILFTQLLDELRGHPSSWPFLEPVDRNQVKDYYEVIKDPMGTVPFATPSKPLPHSHRVNVDLKTLESHIEADKYKSVDEFATDVRKIFANCRLYNDPATPYFKSANKLEIFFDNRLKILSERDNTGL